MQLKESFIGKASYMKGFNSGFLTASFFLYVFLLLFFLSPPMALADMLCPIPGLGETDQQIPYEDQKEISRGTCEWVDIRGKLHHATVSISLEQTTGSGFHFNQDNGPTSVQTNDNKVLICSDSASCGSATITINSGGNIKTIGSVRSDAGNWVYIGGVTGECPISGEYTARTEEGGVYTDELIIGKTKLLEQKKVRYRCNSYPKWCDCTMCYTYTHCIEKVPCPEGFIRISPFCCLQNVGMTQTIYCIQRMAGPYHHEWRCN